MPDGQSKALIDQWNTNTQKHSLYKMQRLADIWLPLRVDELNFTGDGLEFEAVELSLYGRNTK